MPGKGYQGGTTSTEDRRDIWVFKENGESYLRKVESGCAVVVASCWKGATEGGGQGGWKTYGRTGGGGGGGGHATRGTNGPSNVNVPSEGGFTYGEDSLATIFFGSGGGAVGLAVDPTLAHGGGGGGIVIVDAASIALTVPSAVDVAGADEAGDEASNGSGGGGAGGSVLLEYRVAMAGVENVNVGGGAGGVPGYHAGGAGGRGRVLSLKR